MSETNTNSDATSEVAEAASHIQVVTPLVIDLGRVRRKRIKALKKGKGKLMNEVLDVLDEVAVNLGDEAEDKTFVPIIMVYNKRNKKKKRRLNLLPF